MSTQIKPFGPTLEVGTRPYYDACRKLLFFVDVPTSKVYKYNAQTGQTVVATVGTDPICFMFPIEGSNTTYIAALALRLALIEWDGESPNATETQTLATVDGPGRFNGGKVDPYGRLWAGTMGPDGPDGNVVPGKGVLYSYFQGKLQKHEDNIGISNGIAWDTKKNKMYYIDTLITKVFQYDSNPATGAISNKKPVFDFSSNGIEGLPDGLTIDACQNLWVAAIFGSTIFQFNPDNGSLLKKITIPAAQVTAITFGGDALDILYVTTARMVDKTTGQHPPEPAGKTFQVTGTGVKGLQDVRFKK